MSKVYFIQAGGADGAIKIGVSCGSLQRRVRELQVGCPLPLHLMGSVAGDRRHENWLHEQHWADRLHGEWFVATPELLARVSEVLAPAYKWPDLTGISASPVVAILRALGGGAALARALGIGATTVNAWGARGSIPLRHWLGIISVAKKNRVDGISLERFADMAALRRKRRAAAS